MSCTHTSSCELYVQFAADPSIELWKTHYCDGDYKRCVRYERALKGQVVPLNLLPNGKEIVIATDDYSRGIHALFNAIQKNRLPMVKAFLKTKMSSEKVENAQGVTPLMYAAGLGHFEIVKFFLDHDCNPHHKNRKGERALELAEQAGHQEVADILRHYMTIVPEDKEVVSHAVEIDTKDNDAKTGVLSRVLGFLRGSSPEVAK